VEAIVYLVLSLFCCTIPWETIRHYHEMDSFIRRKDTGATYTVGGVHRKYTKYTNIQNTEKYKKI